MNKRFKLLHDKKAVKARELRTLLDSSESAGGVLTAEQKTQADVLTVELEVLNAELAREEKLLAIERELEVPAGARITTAPAGGQDPKRGFADVAELALAVKAACSPGGQMPTKLAALYQAAPTNYHQEGGAAEGFMVPPAFRDEIWGLVFNTADDILGLIGAEPTNSNAVELLADESTPWGATGIQAKWRAEASQMAASKLATDARQVKLHELYAFVLATEELLEDAPRLNARITQGAARAIRWKASNALVWGSGAGQPLGWMTSGALVTVLKEGGQAAATIVTKNISKIYSRLYTGPGSRPFWLGNRDIVPQLAELAIGNQPIWTPPNAGFREAPGGFLLGYPILWTEHAETLGTKGDLQLVDPMGYYATTKAAGVQFASSIHLFFDYNIQAFRWTFRLGGQPFLSTPVNPNKGTATKSHFVCVETRS